MPRVPRTPDDTDPLILPIVGHVSTGQEAALFLRTGLQAAAVKMGGTAEDVKLMRPSLTGRNSWGVQWLSGPTDWAVAYSKEENVDNLDFECCPERGHTIFFVDRE